MPRPLWSERSARDRPCGAGYTLWTVWKVRICGKSGGRAFVSVNYVNSAPHFRPEPCGRIDAAYCARMSIALSEVEGAETWPTADGKRELSTGLTVELEAKGRPVLVRVDSHRFNESYGTFGARRGYMLFTSEGVVLIDPSEVTPDRRAQHDALVRAGGAPLIGTILTSSWHERGSYLLRERLGSEVWMPAAGVEEMEGEPDHLYDATSTLPGGLRAITIDDRFAGDSVLCWTAPGGQRVLFGGDALICGSGEPGHWREATGLHLWMYGPLDEARFRRSFAQLLDEPVDLIFSGHGNPTPVADDAKGTLTRLIREGQFQPPRPLGTGMSLPAAG